jgi:type 1 glutamine amidotransferase
MPAAKRAIVSAMFMRSSTDTPIVGECTVCDAMDRCRVLAVTGGHSFDLDAFRAMFTAICDERHWAWAHAVQPSAQQWIDAEHAGAWDAIVCHDIPGLWLKRGEPPRPIGPSDDQKHAITSLLDAGQGLVVTHHSLAGWPAWDGWATALGGRFNYAPGRLRGQDWPSSGTRIDTYTANIVALDHPVCDGLEDFALTDELYCCPILEDEVVPLLRSNADFDPGLFISTFEHVVVGEAAAPRSVGHPQPSNLIAWATVAGRSPVVYIQPGDSATTFALPQYRRLLANAIAWVASPAARQWASTNPVLIDYN